MSGVVSLHLPISEFQRWMQTQLCLTPGSHSAYLTRLPQPPFKQDATEKPLHLDELSVCLLFHICADLELEEISKGHLVELFSSEREVIHPRKSTERSPCVHCR